MQVSGPGVPEECVSSEICDFVYVDVDLPEGVWAQPGGMLVATRPRTEFANEFFLYIYGPDGEPVANEPVDRSENLWSAGTHAVWVENPADGLYTIVVAPSTPVYPSATGVPPPIYDGFVSFDRGLTVKRQELNNGMPYTQTFVAFGLASPAPAVELLPDLVPTPASNFHIETGVCFSFYLCDSFHTHQPSCYAEETAGLTSVQPDPRRHPLRCLRFDHGEYNFGDGPLEVHLYPDQGTSVSDQGLVTDLYQRVYSSDGSVSQRLVGRSIFHHAHGHWHNLGWRAAALHELLPNGKPGEIVAEMVEKGVCVLDVRNGRFGERRDSPSVYGNQDGAPCVNPSHQDPNDPTFPNASYIQSGISVGWADLYPWSLIDQFIDITNVPDGRYVVVTKMDVQHLLREKSTANNTATACVEISGITATEIPCSSNGTGGAGAKTTGGGWLADAAGNKLNFGFNAQEGGSGPNGNLRLNDTLAGVKIHLDTVSAIGAVQTPCGSVPAASNSLQFSGSGTYNGTIGASFRVCVQDNAEPGKGSDRFYLECTAGCVYTTGAPRTTDDVIDGGNIQVRSGQTTTTSSSSSAEPATIILEPLLQTSGLAGQAQLFTAAVYDQDQQPLPNANVFLTRTAADGSVENLAASTDAGGVASLVSFTLAQAAEYVATAGSAESNTIKLSAGP